MRFWLTLLSFFVFTFLALSFLGVYSGDAVKKVVVKYEDRDKQTHIGGPLGAPSGRCINDFWCPISQFTTGYYCGSGGIYRNQTIYRCNRDLQLCIPQENLKLIQQCNPATFCATGISECQPKAVSWCRDSDHGRDIYKVGRTTDAQGQDHTDYCLSNNELVEGYCNDQGEVTLKMYRCQCENGRCF